MTNPGVSTQNQDPEMSSAASKAVVRFGTFTVTPQVFHLTPLSYALVNLKPIVPGHILICPRRVTSRISSLSSAEVSDLFATVQRVSKTLERVYKASALNIAVQDGEDAGQSVPHVHVHILPRSRGDLDDRGGGDAIYGLLNGEEGDVGEHLKEVEQKNESKQRGLPLKVDADAARKPRGELEMKEEADMLRGEMEKYAGA